MKDMETPAHHQAQSTPGPFTANAEYSEAWTQFFVECSRLAALIRQRRAERSSGANHTSPDEAQTA